MNNTKNLILENIRNQASQGNLKCGNNKVIQVNNIVFNVVTGLKDESVTQINRETIYYEDIDSSRFIIAEFSCNVVKKLDNVTLESDSTGSFSAEYDIETNSLKEDTCFVILRSKF